MSESIRRKPFAGKSPVIPPPVIAHREPVHIPPAAKPSMTPEQLEQARTYASDRPLHRSARPISVEPLIRDPERLAEVRSRLMGEEGNAPNSSFLLDFGRLLKAERERQKLSLSEVSERCGVEKGAISRLENGLNANPTMDTIRRCAQALGKALTLKLVDEEDSAVPTTSAESSCDREELPDPRPSTDPRDWSALSFKSIFRMYMCMWMLETRDQDRSTDLEVPAHLRSDFDHFASSYCKWIAEKSQQLGRSPREEFFKLIQNEL